MGESQSSKVEAIFYTAISWSERFQKGSLGFTIAGALTAGGNSGADQSLFNEMINDQSQGLIMIYI